MVGVGKSVSQVEAGKEAGCLRFLRMIILLVDSCPRFHYSSTLVGIGPGFMTSSMDPYFVKVKPHIRLNSGKIVSEPAGTSCYFKPDVILDVKIRCPDIPVGKKLWALSEYESLTELGVFELDSGKIGNFVVVRPYFPVISLFYWYY